MKNKTYALQFRRKRTGKTDYRTRLALLSSHRPRLIVRKTLANCIAQIAEYDEKGDKIIVGANSTELKKYGWKGSMDNISAAYLTGLLVGVKAKAKGIKTAVPDIGFQTSKKGARIYAAIKGTSDAGIIVPHSMEIMPSQDRIEGKHIEHYATLLKKDQARYNKQFSGYIKAGITPESISQEFKKAKDAILANTKTEKPKMKVQK